MGDARSSSDTSGTTLPRAFNVFWTGQGLSAVGDAMTLVALPLVVFAATGSVAQMGRLTAFARVGALIATAGAGFIVDRLGPRRVMIACDVFRFALMALVPLGSIFEFRALWLVYAVGVGAALGQGIFYVGHVSLVAELVGRARVSLANSRIEGTIALAYVFGPLVAGVVSANFGPTMVLAIDSITFLASVVALLAMGRPTSLAPEAVPAPPSRSVVALVGLAFLRKQPELARLTILVAIAQFFGAGLVDLLIFRLKHDLGQGDAGTGLMFGVASLTAVAAAAVTPWLRAKISFSRIWVAALVLQGVALVATASSNSFALLAATASVYMAAMTTLLICQASIRQELTPQHLLGRVTSAYLVLVTLPMPVGALLATAWAARLGAGYVQSIAGAGLLATAGVATVLWARAPKRETP